jgi:hypothetical protein
VADPSETTQISGPGLEDDRAADESSEVLGAIRDLSERVGDLQGEVQSLRAQSQALPSGSSEAAGWDESRAPGPDMLTWVRAVDAPAARVPAVPRLLLEIVFLVAVAVAAAIAELEAVEIIGVMAIAWLLVALAELVAARAARRRAEMVYAPLPGLSRGYPTDPSWFAPSVERPPVLGLTEVGEDTQPRLPPPSED